ncbi:MAG: hypothetical protein AUI96_01015, partial [Nitrospirae bacterium 13_1_40CM_3_62_11]
MADLRVKLHWLMGVRVVAVTLLLGLSIAFQVARGELVLTFYALIVFTYAITIAYAVTIRYLTDDLALTRFAYLQVGVDLLLESFLVATTGAIESPFSMLYVITVTLASLIMRRRGGLITAGVSVILFGLITNFQLYQVFAASGWLLPSRLSVVETLHTFGVHSLAVITVGVLSGALAESLVEKERGLSRLQAFHENVVESISSGLFTTDASGRITSFNRAAQEITGYDLDKVRYRPWWEVFLWQQAELFGGDPSAAMANPYRFEAQGSRVDGSRLVLGMTVSPLTEGGAQTGLVGVFKDLTQIRDMEEEMRRKEWLAKLGEMSAGMAHEIRNPLAALAGAMQMLRKDLAQDESTARLLDIATREATRLDAIVSEFLLYARPPELNLTECDLNAVLTDTLDLIRHEAQTRKGITIETHPGPGPMLAQVDQDQLKQVFWNLATNAFDAMLSGGRLDIVTS